MATKNVHEITIKVDGKVWTDAIDAAFEKANKDARIDGFRKGKAPKDVFIKKYGETNLWLDAADMVIQDAYKKMLDENKNLGTFVRLPERSELNPEINEELIVEFYNR